MQVATPYADALLAEHGIVGVVGMLKKTLQPSDWKLFFNLTIVIGRLTVHDMRIAFDAGGVHLLLQAMRRVLVREPRGLPPAVARTAFTALLHLYGPSCVGHISHHPDFKYMSDDDVIPVAIELLYKWMPDNPGEFDPISQGIRLIWSRAETLVMAHCLEDAVYFVAEAVTFVRGDSNVEVSVAP